MGRYLQRICTRHHWFIAAVVTGLGSITPDVGHGLNLITGGKVDWGATHTWYTVVLWICFSLLFGLGTIVVLNVMKKCRKLNNCPKVQMVLDKDLPDDRFYAEYIRRICSKCLRS